MSEERQESEAGIVFEFLRAYAEDHAKDALRPVDAYMGLFPGHETLIALEYGRLAEASAATARSAAAGSTADVPASQDVLGQKTLTFGPYEVLKDEKGRNHLLGSGGQGRVYLAQHSRIRSRVALKVLDGADATQSSSQRLPREVEIASKLDHPNICSIYDIGVEADCTWIAMRYVEGQSLLRKIRKAQEDRASIRSFHIDLGEVESHRASAPPREARGTTGRGATSEPAVPRERLELEKIVFLHEQIARALQVAHDQGVIHSDIKPGNIMVTSSGDPIVLDFGYAKNLKADDPTNSLRFAGTVPYMSPEHLTMDRSKLDGRADVWSLAVTLYESLTLHHPFGGGSTVETILAIRMKDPPDPRSHNPSIPRDLKAVLEKALEKNRDRRYRSAMDFAEDLRCIRERRPVSAKPAGPGLRLWRWAQRRPALAASLTALVLALSGGLVVSLHALGRETRARQDADAARGETNRTAATSLMKSASQALSLGRWDGALELLDQAERAGYGDGIEIGLGRIDAREGLLDFAGAKAALDALTKRGDLRSHAAKVRLLQGDLDVDRVQTPDAGLDKVEESLRMGGLDGADEAYARALLAATAEEAKGLFEKALMADSHHFRARQALVTHLVMMGDVVEAERMSAVFGALYPFDPSRTVLESVCLMALGETDLWRSKLGPLKAQFGSDNTATLDLVLSGLEIQRDVGLSFEAMIFADLVDPSERKRLDSVKLKSQQILSRFNGVNVGNDRLRFRWHPTTAKSWWPVINAVRLYQSGLAMGAKGHAAEDQLLIALEEPIRIFPSGYFYFMRGIAWVMKDDCAEAHQWFRKAADTASLVPIRRVSLECLMFCEMAVARRLPIGAKGDPTEAGKRALSVIQEIRGEPRRSAGLFAKLVRFSRRLERPDFALEIAGQWHRERPDDVDALVTLADVESTRESWRAALRYADEALSKKPDHDQGKALRAQALSHLGRPESPVSESAASKPPK